MTRRHGGLRHWLGLALLLLLVAIPTSASAATSVRVFPAAPYLVVHVVPLPAPPVTVGASATRFFRFAPGYGDAGVQGNTPGLQGTTVILASCIGACTDRYIPASAPAIPAGEYAERASFTVTQPGMAGPAVGFDVEVGVRLATGWHFGAGYFSTGLSTRAATSTITLYFYVELGTTAPVVQLIEITVNRCTTTTGCP